MGGGPPHDVGKGLGGDHEVEGAELLTGVMPDRVVWLVRHHLDLLRDPARTRRKLRGTAQLRDLELLRRWDVAGRDPRAIACSVDEAVDAILESVAGAERADSTPQIRASVETTTAERATPDATPGLTAENPGAQHPKGIA